MKDFHLSCNLPGSLEDIGIGDVGENKGFKTAIFFDATPCSLADGYLRFKETSCLQFLP
jgi:hypothetical protein